MQSNISTDKLNTLLKGEQIAIEAYERFIRDVEDANVKEELQNIQQEHKRHASELAERIQTLGGRPEYDTGATGLMANIQSKVQGITGKDTVDILKRAYDGEDKGIAAAEKYMDEGLDEESMKVVSRIMSDDHDHLRKMLGMITKYDIKH